MYTVAILLLEEKECFYIWYQLTALFYKHLDFVFFDIDPRKETLAWTDHKRKIYLMEKRVDFQVKLIFIGLWLFKMPNCSPIIDEQENVWS